MDDQQLQQSTNQSLINLSTNTQLAPVNNQPIKSTFKLFSWINLGLNLLFGLAVFVCFVSLSNQRFGEFFLKFASVDSYQPIQIALAIICFLSFFFNSLQLFNFLTGSHEFLNNQRHQLICLSIMALNPIQLFLNIFYLSQSKSFLKRRLYWSTLASKLGFRRWSVWDVAIVAMFTGSTIFFTFLEGITALPFLPIGGALTVKYLMVMIIAFFHSFLGGFIAGGVAAGFSILVVPSALIVSPLSFLFDYFLPMMSPAVVALMVFPILRHQFKELVTNYVLMTFVTFLLIWFWQTCSGYFVWVPLFGPGWGQSGLVYAILANLAVSFGLNYPITQILVPPVFQALSHLPWDKHQ